MQPLDLFIVILGILIFLLIIRFIGKFAVILLVGGLILFAILVWFFLFSGNAQGFPG